jgi:hypothetical protein
MLRKVSILVFGLIVASLFFRCSDDFEKEGTHFGVKKKNSIKQLQTKHGVMFFKEKPNIKDEIKQTLNKNKSARMSDVYNFEIDDSEVQVIETNDYHVYTFHITSPSSEYMIKNYILVEYSIDSIRHFIADYQYEVVDDEKIFNSQPTLIEINNPNFSSSTNRPSTNISSDCEWVAYFTTETIFIQGNRCGCDGKHLYGDPECNCPNSPPTPGTNQTVNSITWKLECYTPGGGPTNPDPGNGSGGGGGSGDGNSGDEILTVPFDKDDGNLEMDNCDVLKDLLSPQKQNIKPVITQLKQKIASNSKNEWSSSHKMTFNYNFDTDESSIIYTNSTLKEGTSNQVKVTTGTDYVGSTHSHPKGKQPMFSWGDLETLGDTYLECSGELKPYVSIQIVCYNKNNPSEPLVYSLRINDFAKLNNKINNDWGDSKLDGKSAEQKLDIIHEDLARSYKINENNLEAFFLQNFKDYGIDLYKANSDQTNWNKLSLNPTPNNPIGTLQQTPCP